MNNFKAGEVFSFLENMPYIKGQARKEFLLNTENTKLIGISIMEGLLPEHPAPMNALVFAAEGSAIINYEGVDYPIEAGQNFKFVKGALHSVRSDNNFKMFLLLYQD